MEPVTLSEAIAAVAASEEAMKETSASEKQQAVAVNEDAMDEENVTAECFTTEHAQQSEIKSNLSKCVLCSKNFIAEDKPKLLECLHAACSGCIDSKLSEQQDIAVDADLMVENNTILCQACNIVSQPENLIENQFFTKFLEDDINANCEDEQTNTEEEMKCLNCSSNSIATSWCVECELMICQECVKAHSGLKITQAHTIKPLGDISGDTENVKKKESSIYLFCTIHPHEQLSLFCQTCDRLTCRDCQLSEHREHKYKFIHEIAVETRTSIKTLLNEVSHKRELLNTAMGVIKERQRLISDKKKSLVEDITRMVVQLTNAISSRGKELIKRLSEVCDQKQCTLNEKKIALDQLSKLTDHCMDFVNYALDKGTDMELLYNKKSVTSHLLRIKNQRADIPNPDIPVRIHLNVDKVLDLIKVISSIGAIVVDGRVYPSVTPPSDSITVKTPPTETEQKQINNLCAMSVAVDTLPASQSISLLPQQMTGLNHNTYINQSMNIPISSQQILQAQHIPNQQQQMQAQASSFIQHYNTHNTMQQHPLQQMIPTYNANYSGRLTQQQQQHQQQQMIMNQRSGLGNCHQQVYNWQ